MTNEIADRTDTLSELLSEVSFEDVTMIDIDAWTTGHIVRIIEELDAELQRRYDDEEKKRQAQVQRRGVTIH